MGRGRERVEERGEDREEQVHGEGAERRKWGQEVAGGRGGREGDCTTTTMWTIGEAEAEREG